MNMYITKILVLCMVIGVFGVGTAMAAPSVTIDPASTTELSPGDTFSINIHVDPDGNGVSCGQIDLSFDTSVLNVTDLTSGDILGADALTEGTSYDNTAGTVTAVLARKGTTTPPTAAGTWATVTFQVKAGAVDGTTTIAITSAELADENFDDLTGITTTNGTATVGGAAEPPTCTVSVTNTTIVPPQTTDIIVAFSERVQYTLNIETSDGTVVYDWTGERSTDRTVTWNGSYEVNGTQVSDGTYKVNLTVTNTTTELTGYNRTATIVVSSGAANQPPTAVIASPTASGTYREGTEVSFLSTGSSDTDGTIVSYNWTFGDGSAGTGVSTTHTYTTNGSMTVTLTVTDDDGATNSTTVTINVLPAGAVVVTLYEGWNLIAVPVNDTSANTAAELASKITGCKEVVVWDAAGDKYVTRTKIDDDWTGTDFAITGGMGIFVNVEGATTVGFTGDAWS